MTGEVSLRHTDSQDPDFRRLIARLVGELEDQYGALQRQYERHNTLERIADAVVVTIDGEPAACGAFREADGDAVEIKRMYVATEHRRRGLARRVLEELEQKARGRGYRHAVLETGVKQTAAIDLYKSSGYALIENYGPYAGNDNSVCFKKSL